MNCKFLIGTTLLVAGAAFAQSEAIGTASEVQGLVTVSSGSQLGAATPGLRFADKTQFVTGSNSFATLTLNSGCVLRMKPNQSIVVDSAKSCDTLLSMLQGTTREAGALPVGGQGAISAGIFVGAAALANASVKGGDYGNAGNGNGGSGGGSGGGLIPVPPISRQ